jgi:hypothetical protein
MAVAVAPGERFVAGPARRLFALPDAAPDGELDFSPSADASRFLVRVPIAARPTPLVLLQHWRQGLG